MPEALPHIAQPPSDNAHTHIEHLSGQTLKQYHYYWWRACCLQFWVHFACSTFFSTVKWQSWPATIKVMYKSPEPNNIFNRKDHWEYSKHPVQCFDILSEQLTVRADQTALEMHYPPLAMYTMTPRLVSANTWNGIQISHLRWKGKGNCTCRAITRSQCNGDEPPSLRRICCCISLSSNNNILFEQLKIELSYCELQMVIDHKSQWQEQQRHCLQLTCEHFAFLQARRIPQVVFHRPPVPAERIGWYRCEAISAATSFSCSISWLSNKPSTSYWSRWDAAIEALAL